MTRNSITLLALCALSTIFANAQSRKHSVPSFTMAAGAGILPMYYKASKKTMVPPLSLRLGFQVSDQFNLGAYLGYTEANSKDKLLFDGLVSHLENKTLMMGFRCEFRKALTDRFDLYGGGTLGYSKISTKEIDASNGQEMLRNADEPTPYNPNPAKGQLFHAGFIGANWYFQQHIGAFAEVGVGISLANLGLKVRI